MNGTIEEKLDFIIMWMEMHGRYSFNRAVEEFERQAEYQYDPYAATDGDITAEPTPLGLPEPSYEPKCLCFIDDHGNSIWHSYCPEHPR